MTDAYHADSGEAGRVFAQVKKSRLERLRLPDPREIDPSKVQRVAELVENLIDRLVQTRNDGQDRMAQLFLKDISIEVSELF